MSFPAYGSYKESGVEWLGEIPAHWTIMPLKRAVRLVTERAEGRSRAVGLENVESWTGRLLPSGTEFEGEGIAFEPGDILYGKLRPYLAKAYAADFKGEAVGDFHVLRREDGGDASFLTYFLLTREVVSELTSSTYGARMPRVGWEFMGMSPFLVPHPTEQVAIAAFLDRETAKIDALVEAQRRLIDLLKEKRQAVISHAVTKGLDPSAPMKDSGVEWLGQVPAHWEVLPVKRVTRTIEQGWSPQCENYPVQGADEWGVLKVGCVNGGRFAPGENKTLPAELEPLPELGIRSGDLLVSRANTRELVGSAAVAEEAHPNLLLCDKLYRLRLDLERCAPAFLALFLGCRVARQQIELAATGASSSMLNIGQAVILELPLALPPPEEQAATLRWLKVELEKLDSLAANAQALTDVLQERRAALISAAVTGKIDVRGLVQTAEAA